ncbi:MAG: hypothetical protein IJ781_07605 [Atopobiaceae bacterium]|nr:hypothetical protein [Atopobiaceae bacterium]
MKHPAQIVLFLQQMKSIVAEQGFILVERDASMQFLADAGMTIEQLKTVILTLEPEQCFDGPEPDRDPRYKEWTVAEFSPIYGGELLYLKMSIRSEKRRCKCLSVKLYKDRSEL